jgi:hypothetical protein
MATFRNLDAGIVAMFFSGRRSFRCRLAKLALQVLSHTVRRLIRNRENAKEGKEELATPERERLTVGDLLDANLTRAKE